MATNGPDLLTAHVRRLRSAPLAGLSDADLVQRFLRGGSDAGPAFEVIVRRHGPLVLQACRSALGGDHHAADDCFQAVFLVLVRKVRTLRLSKPLGPWLFEVARRVCLQAKADRARRARHEALAAKAEGVATPDGPDDDLAAAVHAEVGRLPRALRSAVVLCDLAGLSYDDAANRLGVTHSTIRGRLARGRDRLRKRLELRGLTPDGIWAAAAVVPASLAGATADAADVMAGRAAGTVPAGILELMNGGLQSMVYTKMKAAGLSALAGSVLIAGALGLGAQTPTTPAPALAPAPEVHYAAGEERATLAAAPDEADLGDEVAALVRKAQRLQDRGDAAGARRTIGQVEAAARRWAAQLEQTAPRFESRPIPTETRPVPATPGRGYGARPAPDPTPAPAGPRRVPGGLPPGSYAPGVAPTLAPAPPATTPGAPAAGPTNTEPSDMEKRLRDLEKKLERLHKQMEQSRPPTEPNR